MASAPPRRLIDVLESAAHELPDALGADGCAISRAIGEVLVLVAEWTRDGRSLQWGQGYMTGDYPETARVLAERTPHAVSLADGDPDPGEVAVLRELGYGALLMLPLGFRGEPWGIAEVFRAETRPFTTGETHAGLELLARML